MDAARLVVGDVDGGAGVDVELFGHGVAGIVVSWVVNRECSGQSDAHVVGAPLVTARLMSPLGELAGKDTAGEVGQLSVAGKAKGDELPLVS